MNWWSLELASYNITFKWISGAWNKAADCLAQLVEVPRNDAAATSILINSVAASLADGPATHTCSKTKLSMDAMPSDNPSPSQWDTTKVNASHLSQKITRILHYKCKEQVCSASTYQNGCSMEKHLTMKLMLSATSMVYSINMPWMPLRDFWHQSSQNHGISQYSSKHTIH